MTVRKIDNRKAKRIANIVSILMFVFLGTTYFLETRSSGIGISSNFLWVIYVITLALLIPNIIASRFHNKMAFHIPFILFLFYTILMILCGWKINYYLPICLAICAISCLYSSFNRTLVFIIVQNISIISLYLYGFPVSGHNVPLYIVLIHWGILFFVSIILLALTRIATVTLDRALEHQQSFMDLLATTENFVAMIDDRNEIVYASKTLADLSSVNDPAMIQGRPLIDIFPGRSLKVYAGKLIKEKYDYSADWEFSLQGQKRYFKAASHKLAGESGGTLISLYDMTHLAERDEIAVMKDSMKIGLFFMDKKYVIQNHYSSYLEEMLSERNLFGKLFTDVIANSVGTAELDSIKDYFKMLVERTYDEDMLEEINPLSELHYFHKRTGIKRVFQCAFATVDRGRGDILTLVTVYDITERVELQKKLEEEQARRQEEMQAVFELIQVQPDTFSEFMNDMEHEFDTIYEIQKDDSLSAHEALVKIYQSVHSIKSNAVILGLSIFGNKVHNLESKIKMLREIKGDVPFADMLDLTMEIDKISSEREGFKEIIDKLSAYTGGARSSGEKQNNANVLLESLTKTTLKAAEDQGKLIQLIAKDIDEQAIEKGPKRVIKEVLMQLIRNSAVHGIEDPETRKSRNKNETGTIRLSVKMAEDHETIQIKLSDDGNGLNYKVIAEKAISRGVIKKEDANNKELLVRALFSPGFSTAESEGMHAGRGIGLNLVRDRLKEIGGSIKLRAEEGKGIIFLITAPILLIRQ